MSHPVTATSAKVVTYSVAAGAFALGMASYVTAGLIPMIARDFTVSVGLAAQLVTAFTLAYGLGSPLLVACLPATARKASLLLLLLVFVLANAASAMASEFVWLMILRAIAGVSAGTYLALGMSAVASVTSAERRGQAISHIMGGMASGTVLGVPVGLWCAHQWGWPMALGLIALTGAMAWVGLWLYLPALSPSAVLPFRQKLRILKDGQVNGILSVSLLAAISSLGLYTFMSPLVAVFTAQSITPFLWIWGVGGIVGSFCVGPLADRWSGSQLTLVIMGLLTLALITLPLLLAVNPWLGLLPIALWGAVGWALQVPQNKALIKAREAHGDGQLALALNESALYLGSAIGALLGGVLMSHQASPTLIAWLAGAVALLGVWVQWSLRRRQGRTVVSSNA
ncbi:hypothetical protein BFW38_00610 [Terasakiispira papahanaumokuakeensis]|uniref:Major facilitator superfamily (MFS) profile domain-containing protein n=1 Tax=Terasakiispira papahanaumokuakeensis TaxID=197479 RepID=A0A1E2V5X7_9GAMM|nr:MFS transporter [Terasakiispira papahanaumokuakeensis]ODC02262.1 hypothetical protein BFW38_00610 [Terasakiispira papahanaumokuakeensis]